VGVHDTNSKLKGGRWEAFGVWMAARRTRGAGPIGIRLPSTPGHVVVGVNRFTVDSARPGMSR